MSRLTQVPGVRRVGSVVREIVTTTHALVVFSVVESTIRWVPLPRLAAALGCRIEFDAPDRINVPRASLRGHAVRQIRCVRRVARRWPFAVGPCLRTSLVGGHLLRRMEPAIRIGSIGSGAELSAHAWIEIGGHPLEPTDRYRVFRTPHGGAA